MSREIDNARETARIDRLMWMLRLAPTRGAAQARVGEGHIRVNGRRVLRAAQPVAVGDVLTIPCGRQVRVIEIVALPTRRGPAAEARAHYREVDLHEPANASQQCGPA